MRQGFLVYIARPPPRINKGFGRGFYLPFPKPLFVSRW